MVIFMLLERRDLRDRLIGLFGHRQLTVTTKAFDEAGTRVSRQLLMQSLVNLIYGIAAGLGLYALGVPYPLVWATLGAALRFIPYVGPVIGAGAPILVSLAALPGWCGPSLGGELVRRARAVHQPRYRDGSLRGGGGSVTGRAACVLSVLDVVVGPPRLAHGDTVDGVPRHPWEARTGPQVGRGCSWPTRLRLPRSTGYYQRLLARDQSEAADLIERHITTEPPRSVYDALLLPALNYAERDRLEQRLSLDEETAVVDAI